MAIKPVVSIGLKLSKVSMDASSSEYSFSVWLDLPRTYALPLYNFILTSPLTLRWENSRLFSMNSRSGEKYMPL